MRCERRMVSWVKTAAMLSALVALLPLRDAWADGGVPAPRILPQDTVFVGELRVWIDVPESAQVFYKVTSGASIQGTLDTLPWGSYAKGRSIYLRKSATVLCYARKMAAETTGDTIAQRFWRKLPPPEFNPPGGVFVDSVGVHISVEYGARCHYTLDETVPTAESPTYSAPLRLRGPQVIVRAVAMRDGCIPSAEASEEYRNASTQ